MFSCFVAPFALEANGQQAGNRPPKAAAAPKKALPAEPKTVDRDGPSPGVHPHKVYVDSANNSLFWPMDMPFWVRLAAAPDADAPTYLLQRVSPDSGVTTEKYNKQGIGLEIQGKQFIRWFNVATKENVNLQFFTDGDPPVTKATCTGAPTAVQGQRTYYGSGLRCTIASMDELSGVEQTFLSIDNEAYRPYTGQLVLDKEKEVVLRYYAVDNVGYSETPSVLRFTVDLTSPVTRLEVQGNALGYVLSSQAKFVFTSSDALSGVAGISARFDKQDFKPIADGQIRVESLPDGDHTLSYYAVDKVNNRETEHVIPFYVDRVPPKVDSAVEGDISIAPNGTRYVSGRSKVKLTAGDNKTGVDKIEYSFDGTKFDPYTDVLVLPLRSGAGKLSFKSNDKLGNTSAVTVLPYWMDLAAPQSNYKITGPMYQLRSDVYITKDSRIGLSSNDDASGVQIVQYMSEDAPQQTYQGPLAFPNEGRRLLRYWATDKVNNRELERAVQLITDNTPPSIIANFSLPPVTPKDAQGPPVYRRNTSVFLAATDNAAGVRKVYYSFNGGKEEEYSTPLTLDKEGSFDMLIRAEDNVGNISSTHVTFVVRG